MKKWAIWQKRDHETENVAKDGRRMLAEQQEFRDCAQKQVTISDRTRNRSLAASTRNGHATTSPVIGGEVGLDLTDHQTHQTSSFFPSCTGLEVSGGNYNSSRDHHSTGNVIINVTSSRSPTIGSPNDDPVDIHRSSPGFRRNRQILEPQSPVIAQNSLSPTISRSTGQSPSPRSGPTRTLQKSSEIYYRHLLTSGRGSPLWIPDPSSTLSLEYQREGIGVGDVIILTDSGGTDFMFNVYHPKRDSDHPINPPEMPEGYSPLDRPGSLDMTSHVEFKNNSFLTSSFVNSRRDEEFSGLIFESSAMDGAILTMPNGANSTDLQNKTTIRKYARQNAVQWYRYANEVRGRDVRNGDLRLVVGKTSTTTWGMATFAECSNSESAFSLKFKPSGNGPGGTSPATYGWECSFAGMATTKSGPDSHEIERLRDNHVDGGDPERPKVYENQCLFVRTINVMLQDDVWDKLMTEWKTLGLVEDEGPSSGPSSDTGFGSGGSNVSSGAYGSQTSSGSSGMSSVGNQLGTQATEAGADEESRGNLTKGVVLPPGPQGTRQRSSVHLSTFPPPLGLHPSKIINQFLLRERPQAKIAITEDKDWISVLDKNEKDFPEPDILISRMMSKYELIDETDVVCLKLRDIPDVTTISPPSLNISNKPPGIVSEGPGLDADLHQGQQHFDHTSEARSKSPDSPEVVPSIPAPITSRATLPVPVPSSTQLFSSLPPDHAVTSPNATHTPLDSPIKFYKSPDSLTRKPLATYKARSQERLLEMAREPGNTICADCKARVPRWASYNLGIFICVNCAIIHRKMGTHVSKVKSLTLDDWTMDQIQFMRSMGNNKSNALYNPNELRNPPPPDIENDGRDGEMERYIRSKYEHKMFMAKSAPVASKLGSAQLAALVKPTSTAWPSPAANKYPSSLPPTYPMPPRQPYSPQASQSSYTPSPYISHHHQSYVSSQSMFGLSDQINSTTSGFPHPMSQAQTSSSTLASSGQEFLPTSLPPSQVLSSTSSIPQYNPSPPILQQPVGQCGESVVSADTDQWQFPSMTATQMTQHLQHQEQQRQEQMRMQTQMQMQMQLLRQQQQRQQHLQQQQQRQLHLQQQQVAQQGMFGSGPSGQPSEQQQTYGQMFPQGGGGLPGGFQ